MYPNGPTCDGSHAATNFEDLEATYKVGFNRHRRILLKHFKHIKHAMAEIKKADPTYETQGLKFIKMFFEQYPETKDHFRWGHNSSEANLKKNGAEALRRFEEFVLIIERNEQSNYIRNYGMKYSIPSKVLQKMGPAFLSLVEDHIGELDNNTRKGFIFALG